jgi:hypothetical protein
MALGDVVALSDIPYLSKEDHSGRFLASPTFFDGGWRMWMQTESTNRFVEVHAWPAEALYFAVTPEEQADICSEFLDFVAQRANRLTVMKAFSAIQEDICNLAAALAKFTLIRNSESRSGSARMAATQVEYILTVCRSMFDLLQEVIKSIWETVRPFDGSNSKPLKKSFAEMTLYAERVRTAEEIAAKFQLPAFLAECYAGHAPIFLKIRQLRDRFVHGGSSVPTIFHGEEGFLIRRSFGPFQNLDIWRTEEMKPNELAPLEPLLGLIVHATLAACEDFAATLLQHVRFDDPMVPGMRLYLRGYFNESLIHTLADADTRLAEGRSLGSGVRHLRAE